MILFPPLVVALLVFLFLRARDARLAALPDVAVGAPATWTPTRVVVTPARLRSVVSLALVEARLVLLHPALLCGLGLTLLAGGTAAFDSEPFARYVELTGGGASAMYLPSLVFVASGLCASRPRRAGAGELFDATTATPFDRTLAQCLAALGPFLGTLAIVFCSLAVYTVAGAHMPATPPVWELLTLPLSVLGAALLGVQASRWLPFRGAPLLVLVAAVSATLWLTGEAPYLAPYVEWPEWRPDQTYVMREGPAAAHTFFVLGLDVAAAIGALLTYPDRRRLLLGLGFVTVVATTLAGLAAT